MGRDVECDLSPVVRRAQAGDRVAVEQLVRRFLRPAYLVALSVLRVPVEAEDVAQEAVVMAMQNLSKCKDTTRFAGWLMSTVRNRALNAISARQVRARYAANAVVPEPLESDRIAMREELLVALEVLPAMQREVVLLHDLESWTHQEISVALGVTEVNSRQMLFLARRALRSRLAQLEEVGVPHDG